MGLIKKMDFLYHEAHFTFNKHGDPGLKTVIGGYLSLITILLSIFISFYFIILLFLKKDATVIFSSKQDSNINLLYSYKLPFLFRLSDRVSYPLEHLNLYEVKVNFWYSIPSLNGNITVQQYTNLTYKKCNLYEHFDDEYKKYFINDKDLETFFCLDPRNKNITLFGSYGDIKSFSIIHFDFYICNNETMKNQCLSKENIQTILNDAYLDLRYINYNIESNKQHVKTIYIKNERIPISYSVFKRLWINFKTIEFISDNGFIFSRSSTEIFHQFSDIRIDTDIRDIVYGTNPGNFFALTFSLNGEVNVFNKTYQKLQHVLGTIGGLIKAITFFTQLLNYYNAKNSYYKKIIKDFLIENGVDKKKKNISISNKDKLFSSLVNTSTFKLNIKENQQNIIFNSLENKLKNKDNLDKKFKSTIFPLKLMTTRNIRKEIKWYIETINNKLNIIYILNILEGFNKLKGFIQKKNTINQIKQINSDFYKNNYVIN